MMDKWIKLSDKQPADLSDVWRWAPMFSEPRLECYMKQKFELGMYGDDSYWIQAHIPQPPKK